LVRLDWERSNGCALLKLLKIYFIKKTAVPNSPANPLPIIWITLARGSLSRSS
jgi:hypothetical protein